MDVLMEIIKIKEEGVDGTLKTKENCSFVYIYVCSIYRGESSGFLLSRLDLNDAK